MTKDAIDPINHNRATYFGIGAFCVTLAFLWFLIHDLIFSTVIGCVFGFGVFDLTLFLLSKPVE
jgi:hypothetical protein